MPSSSPLNPKATVFTPKIPIASSSSQHKLNPKPPVFVPRQQQQQQQQSKVVQGLLQQLQASCDSYRVYY
jgi:hypothetical protein